MSDECMEMSPGLVIGPGAYAPTLSHGSCPCRKTCRHRVHRCEHGTEWWDNAIHDPATATVALGEGDGTGSGPVEAHGAAEGLPKWEADLLERNAARDAAIEAAARAFGNHVHQADLAWETAPQTTREFWTACAVEAVRAAEPILRQAVAEEIARALESRAAPKVNPRYQEIHYLLPERAAEIAREVGHG